MLQVWALEGIPEVAPGADLVALIADAAGGTLVDGDILIVTSKIVSKAEGRIIEASDREAAIDTETVRVVASRTSESGHVTRIVESRLGIIAAAAGVDASNTPHGTVLLLPVDPDASARALAAGVRERLGVHVGVIVSDTMGRAWRDGQTDTAIGAGGVHVFEDLRGQTDAEGRPLVVTMPCVADELASAGDLVKRKAAGRPIAVVRGRGDLVGDLDLPGARSIIRPAERDFFHTGSAESYAEGFAAGAASAAP
ncbi:coenzyme F420-0:L-glutamate ligase [Microbacterium sp. RU33B]|uniref:coenzyme F420-0:L-glutamate ligase n=1 Tax=Microbacterium sp. RU33B TaxID=1907390 RepID=UPI0009605D72|nr:coenzyme F420-0:L-glutamate ligase [Microbacterium sp. RU33B]SIT86864.1 coenzyme F420-0:L-glutamate ligase / coenzyme F420-1:gamma-L-glutamate ligase [Microbacterium sp. RU33B]